MKFPSRIARIASTVPNPCWIRPPMTAQMKAMPNPDHTRAGSRNPSRAAMGTGME